MPELYIQQCRVVRFPDEPEAENEALARWRRELGPRRTRRMSPLGLAVTAALRGCGFHDDPTLLYTTTYTETRALENFIDSFPSPSPLYFQSSIHPGGAEQAMIARQQAVTEFFPLAGSREIITQGLKTALLSARPRIIWLGGEEKGTWMLDAETAGATTFGWALTLAREPQGACGRLSWRPGPEAGFPAPAPCTARFCEALETREVLRWGSDETGHAALEWL